ncbi:MAG TPA: hypothetical protein VL175_06105 [Pirellulales bacterium]|jgi:hypothetical protein|nr:hypothetical protein [Pirellulales bacterium]
MDAQRWLSRFRIELTRHRLPPHYVERLAQELSDHIHDFMEDRMSTDAKNLPGLSRHLGAPSRVATEAAMEYRRGRFAARHPILMFVLTPILTLPVLWATYVIAILLVARILGLESGTLTSTGPVADWASATMPFLIVGLLLMPSALCAALYCRLADRAALSWKWPLTAGTLIAVLGGLAVTNIVLPRGSIKGTVTFGFGLSSHPSASQVLQFLLPMVIVGWTIWRRHGRSWTAPLGKQVMSAGS